MLPRWFEVFDRDSVHVILLEEMSADPASALRSVLEFLGVDPEYQPETFDVFNPNKRPRSRRLARVTARFPKRSVRRNLVDQAAWNVFRLIRRANRVRASRSPVDAAIRRELEQDLADDVQQLSVLLGRDVAALWWGAPAPPSRHKGAPPLTRWSS
jgi:hypothetical protein